MFFQKIKLPICLPLSSSRHLYYFWLITLNFKLYGEEYFRISLRFKYFEGSSWEKNLNRYFHKFIEILLIQSKNLSQVSIYTLLAILAKNINFFSKINKLSFPVFRPSVYFTSPFGYTILSRNFILLFFFFNTVAWKHLYHNFRNRALKLRYCQACFWCSSSGVSKNTLKVVILHFHYYAILFDLNHY